MLHSDLLNVSLDDKNREGKTLADLVGGQDILNGLIQKSKETQ